MKRTSTLKRSGFKRKPTTPLKRSKKPKVKREKLPSVKTTRNKADALLTPLIKLMHPLCMLCNHPTEVAHHHVHKGASTRLRYELDNLIPLCNHCHLKLHHNESYWASQIVSQRGVEWFQRISKLGQEEVKADVHYYISNYNRLKALKDSLDAMG